MCRDSGVPLEFLPEFTVGSGAMLGGCDPPIMLDPEEKALPAHDEADDLAGSDGGLWGLGHCQDGLCASHGQDYVPDRLHHEKATSRWHDTEGWPDSDVPDSNRARYRRDVGVTSCAQRSGNAEDKKAAEAWHREQHRGSVQPLFSKRAEARVL